MNVPETVKIGYKDYAVEIVPQLDDGTNELYGECAYDIEKIRLCARYPVNQQKCTLIHELIHALDDMYHVGLSEKQTIRLGKGL